MNLNAIKPEFQTHRVSSSEIKVSKQEKKETRVKGSDWFSREYPNIFLLGKKASGKSTVVQNILEHCSGKNTKFIFIVTTIDKDQTWKNIVNTYERKGNDVITYTDITDEEGNNVITDFIDSQKLEAAEEKEQAEQIGRAKQSRITSKPIQGGGRRYKITTKLVPVEPPKEPPKPKLIYPETILIMDDLGMQMRNKAVTQLLKTNRHYKTMVIMSSQSLSDLEPAARLQLDYILIFGKQPDEKLQKIREELDLGIDQDKFINLYNNATAQPYQFLYVGRLPEKNIYRKGFTQEYNIRE